MKTFTLNGKTYTAKEIDFNMICDLEEQGISLEDIEKKPMSMIRTYIAICMNATKEYAGKQMEEHFINGGKLDDVATVMGEAMETSGFFQALNKGTEKKTTTSRAKKSSKVVEITEV